MNSELLMKIILGLMRLILVVFEIVFLIGLLSSTVRRCHDIGKNGLTVLWCYIGSMCCGIGGIVWLIFSFFDSKEDNQRGENPKTLIIEHDHIQTYSYI